MKRKSIKIKIQRKQAGLSRATLKISSEFSSNFPLRTHKSHSIQWLLRCSTFNFFRSSSIGGHLPSSFGGFKNMIWSSKLKFEIWVWSNKRLLRYSTFNIFRPSSIGGRLHSKDLYIIVWSSKVEIKFEKDSIHFFLRYSTLNILSSSSIGGCLHLKNLYNIVWSAKLKF